VIEGGASQGNFLEVFSGKLSKMQGVIRSNQTPSAAYSVAAAPSAVASSPGESAPEAPVQLLPGLVDV
jgi:hypothetical protein